MGYSDSFWTKVATCKHRWSPWYSTHVYGCTCHEANEIYCLKCHGYKVIDPCGEMSGWSGWPFVRWRHQQYKRIHLKGLRI